MQWIQHMKRFNIQMAVRWSGAFALTMTLLFACCVAQAQSFKEWMENESRQKETFQKEGAVTKPVEKEPSRERPVPTPRSETHRQPESTAPAATGKPPVAAAPVAGEKAPVTPQPPVPRAAETPEKPAFVPDGVSPLYAFLKKTILNMYEGKDISESNYVNIINDGYEALVLRIHLIRQARKSIDIQTYIFRNDEVGRLVMWELIQAAKRGVKVRIIADHFSSERDPALVAFLATVHPNFEIRHYRPAGKQLDPTMLQEVVDYVIPNKSNQRMHNKLFLVDQFMGITGGRNIQNCYYNFATGINFKDRDVLLVGPLAQQMYDSFEEYWTYKRVIPSKELKDVGAIIKKGDFPRYDKREHFVAAGLFDDLNRQADDPAYIESRFARRMIAAAKVTFLVDKPGKNRKFFFFYGRGEITKAISTLVQKTKYNLVMQTPYLVLDAATRKMFAKMKKKEPKLRLIVSSNSFGSTDNLIAYSANFRMRSTYIQQVGLEIYEYKPHPDDLLRVLPQYPSLERRSDEAGEKRPFLCIHAKSFVMDGAAAFIGSYNLDPRSANANTEIGLLIEDPFVAELVQGDIMNDIQPANSWVIAKRDIPLPLEKINQVIETTLSLTPVDVWPFRNTTSYELVPGREPCPPSSKQFYDNYHDIGNFPGADPELSEKELTTLLLKAMSGVGTRLL